jgi:hypothetical protein
MVAIAGQELQQSAEASRPAWDQVAERITGIKGTK